MPRAGKRDKGGLGTGGWIVLTLAIGLWIWGFWRARTDPTLTNSLGGRIVFAYVWAFPVWILLAGLGHVANSVLERIFGREFLSPATRRRLHRGLAGFAGAVGAVFGTLGAVNLGLVGGGTPEPPDAVKEALRDPSSMTQADRQAVLDYAATLEFDTDTHGAADRRRLSVPVSDANGGRGVLAIGPLAVIAPEKNTHRNRRDAIDQGRIIARIETDGAYEKLGVRTGVNYVWVDSVVSRVDTTRRILAPIPRESLVGLEGVAPEIARAIDTIPTWAAGFRPNRATEEAILRRAVIISADPTQPVVELPMYLFQRNRTPYNMALARWLYRDEDDDAWENCGKDYCCCMGICVE